MLADSIIITVRSTFSSQASCSYSRLTSAEPEPSTDFSAGYMPHIQVNIDILAYKYDLNI